MRVILIAAAVVLTAAAVGVAITSSDADTYPVAGQGGAEPALAADGATLHRDEGTVRIRFEVPTPEPGSYEYPTGDMAPPGATHPDIVQGGPGAPEVFTLWGFVFNHPDRCTNGSCDFDDIGEDTAARGGIFQLDAVIAGDDHMTMLGTIRLGQQAVTGASLENPLGAEIHAAIAPHGRALSGEDLILQLNGSVGNPTLWWSTAFPS